MSGILISASASLLRKSIRSVASVMMGHPDSPHPARARLPSPRWRGARAVLSCMPSPRARGEGGPVS
jgi:hypothetical protein